MLYNLRLPKSELNFNLALTLEVIFHFLIMSSLLMLRGALPFVFIISMFLLKLSLNSKFIITLSCSPCHGAFEVFEFFKFVLIWFSSFFDIMFILFSPYTQFEYFICLLIVLNFSTSPFDINKNKF